MEELRIEVNGIVSVHNGRVDIDGKANFALAAVAGLTRPEPNLVRLLTLRATVTLSFADKGYAEHVYERLVDATTDGLTVEAFDCGDEGESLRYSHHLLSIGWLTLHHDTVGGLLVDSDESGSIHLLLKDGRTIHLTSIGEAEHDALYKWFTRGMLDDGKDGVTTVNRPVFTRPS